MFASCSLSFITLRGEIAADMLAGADTPIEVDGVLEEEDNNMSEPAQRFFRLSTQGELGFRANEAAGFNSLVPKLSDEFGCRLRVRRFLACFAFSTTRV